MYLRVAILINWILFAVGIVAYVISGGFHWSFQHVTLHDELGIEDPIIDGVFYMKINKNNPVLWLKPAGLEAAALG